MEQLLYRSRKATILIETIIAASILLVVLLSFATLVVSLRPLLYYQLDRLVVYNLAYMKAKEIQGLLLSHSFSDTPFDMFYGFPYLCGSSEDIALGDDSGSLSGTFISQGHPEVRYQYYFVPVTDSSGQVSNSLVGVALRVWKYASWRSSTTLNSLIKVDYYFEVRR
ncbi:MAG: hypothetical protein QXS21_04880 [Thermoproteota archaeon]